jgi:hypothetical protein
MKFHHLLAECMARRLPYAITASVLLVSTPTVFAQLLNYGEQMANYKDTSQAGIRLQDGVFPAVSAKARVNRAISEQKLVDQNALMQPDGTLKLPEGQNNLVIRSTLNDVQRGADGTLRIASPTIQGNINGQVTLYVEGRGLQNITVLNNPR